MSRDTVVAAIARRLGRRTDMDADILLEMDIVQSTILERNGRIVPWFLPLTVNSALVMTAGAETVSIPTGFVGIPEDGGLFVQNDDGDWERLTKMGYDEALVSYQDDTDQPEAYSIADTNFRLRPLPDKVYTLRGVYKVADALPSATAAASSNLWMTYAQDLLIYATAQWCARDLLQDFELAATFDGSLKTAWDRLFVETERRMHDDREYHMGDS